MDRRQASALLTLQELGIRADLSDFDRRLMVQKALYLVEESGLDLGYFFHWYLRGPYSPGVSRDLFPAVDELDSGADPLKGWSLDSESRQRLQGLRPLLQPPDQPSGRLSMKDQAHWLELLASVHYLVKRGQVSDGPEAISAKLKACAKDFSPSQVRSALKALREFDLLRNASKTPVRR